MKLSDRYDVVCAGGGLSAFLCGALLARAGKKVLVVDEKTWAIPCSFDGQTGYDPDFNLISGLGETAALGKSLRELGIAVDETLFEKFSETIQVMTPEFRTVISSDREKMRVELLQKFRDDDALIHSFFSLIAESGSRLPEFIEEVLVGGQVSASEATRQQRFFGVLYSLLRRVKPVALRDALLALKPSSSAPSLSLCENLLRSVLGSLSFSTPSNLGAEQTIRGLAIPMQGVAMVHGGMQRLKDMLGEVVCANGGHVKAGGTVEGLTTDGNQISGLLLSSFEGIVRGDVVVLTSKLKRIYSTLPKNLQDTTVLRSLGRLEPATWRYSFSVTVNEDVIPIGATSSMSFIRSFDYPLEEENFVQIQILPKSLSERDKSSTTRTVLVSAHVPYRASSLNYGYLRRLGGKMLRVVSDVMPFLEDNILSVYPDFREDEQAIRECYPFSGVDWVPENLVQFYVRGQKSAQDFFGPAWATPHENLYFAGRSIWPALGVYGEALSARKIYEDILLVSRTNFVSRPFGVESNVQEIHQ